MKNFLIVKLMLIKEMRKPQQGCIHMINKVIRRGFQKMMELRMKMVTREKLSGYKRPL